MKYTITGRSLIEGTSSGGYKVYSDDNISVRVKQDDYTISPPYYLHLKAGKKILITARKNIDFLSTNLYFANDADNNISNNPQSIIHSDTGTNSYNIQSSKGIGVLSFKMHGYNNASYDDIYVSTNDRVNFVIYYKIDKIDDGYEVSDYYNIVLQIGSTDLNNNRGIMYCLMPVYAQSIGIGWDYTNSCMSVDEDSVIAAIINCTYKSSSYLLEPLTDDNTTYRLSGDFSLNDPIPGYYGNYRYIIETNTVDADEDFELTYTIDEYEGYTIQQFNKTALSSFTVDSSTTNILYNKINVNIPTKEYVLDLHKLAPPPAPLTGNPVSEDGRIDPIEPTNYLINKISGSIRVADMTFTSTENGENTYKHDTQFYNAVTVNTNVQSIGDMQVKVRISDIDFDKDLILTNEASIIFNITYNAYDNYELYTSINGTTFSKETTGYVTAPVKIGDTVVTLYYKFKNINDNTYTSVSTIEVPIKDALLYNINTPEIQAEKISGGIVRLYVKNTEWISYGLTCILYVNNINHTINSVYNNGISINSNSEYTIIEAYFAKNINGNVYTSNKTNLILDTKTLSIVSITEIEYRDTAYIYSKVPTKYYGIYLTLLKLLSNNGEQLVQDCANACKSSSHKLTSLWNMFNAACAAYLNNNEKLADLLIKTITSQLNIMYDENYDFIQHRVFIGNYTLNNKNNPNEFETVDLYKLTPSEYDICSELELKFTINQTSDIHYIMLPPELDLQYVSFGDTIKTVLFDAEKNINLYKERSWRMADKDTNGTIYWYYSSAGAFNDIITIICKYK